MSRENRRHDMVGTTSPRIQERQHDQGERCRWYAASGKPSHHPPVGRAVEAVHKASDRLGSCCEKQVCADSSNGGNAEQNNEDRRHQRSTSDAGHANKRADEETGDRVGSIEPENIARPSPAAGLSG
jgi:hypothetical protein